MASEDDHAGPKTSLSSDSMRIPPINKVSNAKETTFSYTNVLKPGTTQVTRTGQTAVSGDSIWNPHKQEYDTRLLVTPVVRHQLIGDNTLHHAQRPDIRSILKDHIRDDTLDLELNDDTKCNSTDTPGPDKDHQGAPPKKEAAGLLYPEKIYVYIARLIALVPHVDHHHAWGAVRLKYPKYSDRITASDVWEIRTWLETQDMNTNLPQARILGLARHVGEEDQFKLVRDDRTQIQKDLMEAALLGLDEADGPTAAGQGITGGLVW